MKAIKKRITVRRKKVRARSIVSDGDYTPKKFTKSDKSRQFLESVFRCFFVFESLSESDIRDVIHSMEKKTVYEGDVIITQGDIGDCLYILETGKVSFIVDGKEQGTCDPGAVFGELALIHDVPRAATCRALGKCDLWKLDQRTFHLILSTNMSMREIQTTTVLKKVELFKNFEEKLISKISSALSTVKYEAGERIVNKGDTGDIFYIVGYGSLKIHDIGFGESQYTDQIKKVGDFFGERALLTGEPRAANVTALSECILMCLSRVDFEQTIGKLDDLMDEAMKKEYLQSVPIIANSKLSKNEIDSLVGKMMKVFLKKGSEINDNNSLLIMCEGKIILSLDNGMINTMQPGDHIGAYNLKKSEDKYSLKVIEDSVCFKLKKDDMTNIIGSVNRLGSIVLPVSAKLEQFINLSDLTKKKMLGRGAYGEVWMCTKKDDKNIPFALKCMSKADIIERNHAKYIIREKNVMSSVDHPCLVRIIASFQDETTLYLLQPFFQGGELFALINSKGKKGLKINDATFYAACTLDALAHMHDRNIVHRDLKPENCLIDSEGYSILIDMGFAKIIQNKSFTMCGTPEYLPPEMISSRGHNNAADYWCLGVLIYEMIVGVSPFYSRDQRDLYRNILSVRYSFPSDIPISISAKHLINNLLKRDQSKRLGMLSRGVLGIKEHMFFHGLDWNELLQKQMSAPHIPEVKNALDCSEFTNVNGKGTDYGRKKKLTEKEQLLFKQF